MIDCMLLLSLLLVLLFKQGILFKDGPESLKRLLERLDLAHLVVPVVQLRVVLWEISIVHLAHLAQFDEVNEVDPGDGLTREMLLQL